VCASHWAQKPKGAMKVNNVLARGRRAIPGASVPGRSMAPSRLLAVGWRKSVRGETRKMVNYS
jgi:hypothetical protein